MKIERIALPFAAILVLLTSCSKTGSQSENNVPLLPSADRAAAKFHVSFRSDSLTDNASARSAGVPGREAEDEHAASSFGTISGTVQWVGPLPRIDSIFVSRDSHACAEHGKHDRPPDQLVVNPSDGGVKHAVVHLIGNFDHGKPLGDLKYTDTLNQRMCSYEPRVFVVPLGAKLIATSDDDVGHNVRMSGAADLNIAISKGGRSSRRMEQPGVVKLGCDIHPWMTGSVHVVKHPYYAVTGSDGHFELTDVPAGTHQIRLWHEPWWTEDGTPAAPFASTHSVTVRAGQTIEAMFELSDPSLLRMAGNPALKATGKR
jgi:hypothetical protein